VGATCIYLLTGKSPKDLDYNPLTGEILWQHKVQVSESLAKVLTKMLQVSVQHRYQSAEEVLKALEDESDLNSLALGMAAQPSGKSKQTIYLTEPDDDLREFPSNPEGGYFYTRSVTQVAEEIRARQAKLAKATSVKPKTTPYRVLTTKPSTATILKTQAIGHKPKVTHKLDADTLLTAYIKGRRNFALHDLSQLDLQKADLGCANFYCSKLDKTNLQEANLFNSSFCQADFKQANLKKANLSRAYLNQADLEGADLRGADLSYANFNNANLRGANLCGEHPILAETLDSQ